METRNKMKGMTLIEMLVVISIITILAAIALPAISAARESARNSACQANLHEFGVGLAARADRQRTYCSGAFDWRRDGAVTEYGWVADLVKQGTLVGKMLCPSSNYPLSETYHDLVHGTFTSAEQQANPKLAGSNALDAEGLPASNPCKELLTLPAGSEQRRALVETKIYGKGYNTNYVATWLLVRSALRLGTDGNVAPSPSGEVSPKSVGCTVGPNCPARVDRCTSTTLMPLLACGAGTGGLLQLPVGDAVAGQEFAESFSDGPVDPATMQLPVFPSGTPAQGATGWSQKWRQTRQDYRDLGTVHGRGNGSCNVLFADGGVRVFVDQNGDRVLNNGFPASASSGFADNKVELPEIEIYSGWQ